MEMTRPPFKDWTVEFNRGKIAYKYKLSWFKLFEGNVVVQPKYDGRWGLLHHEEGSEFLTLWSRHGKIQNQVIVHELMDFPEFKLHGEYIFGTSFAKSSPLENKLIVFDYEIEGLPLHERLAKALSLVFRLQQIGIDWVDFIEGDVAFDCEHSVDVIKEYLSGDRVGKVEGVVLKQADSMFGDTWVRIKPIYDMDYVVLGFNQSDSDKYRGRMIKSIRAGIYINGELTEVCQVGGMNEAERSDMYQNPDKYIGKVFTATGKDIFKSGALRHPNYLRMHPEKKAQECILN